MTPLPKSSLDTPGDGRRRLSAHNFREVAPEVLSPLSWSLIGAGMEAGFRDLAASFAGQAPSGPPRFALYVGYRPYHGMDAIEDLLLTVPWMRRSDPWYLLLGRPQGHDVPTPRATLRTYSVNGWRFVREFRTNGTRLGIVSADVAASEHAADEAVRLGGTWALGAAADQAVATARAAWALHARTASAIVCAGAFVQRLLAFEHGPTTARELLAAVACRDAGDTITAGELSLVGGGTEVPVSYELAPPDGRFGRWASTQAPTLSNAALRRGAQPSSALLPLATPLGELVDRAIRLFRTCLDERERSKVLALRALHVVRFLLPRGLTALAPDDAALLGAGELRNASVGWQRSLVSQRAEELEASAAVHLPVDIVEHADGWRPSVNPLPPSGPQRGTGLAPGWAAGITSELGDEPDAVLCGYRVEAYHVLQVAPVAVVSVLGSVLSHVAIVCRELGIPMVASITPPLAGTRIAVDGWEGTVSVDG